MLDLLFDSPWYWFSAGLLLLLLEVLIPGAFLLWIGLGAAGVGVFLFIFPAASLVWQLLALAGCVFAAVLLGIAWQKKSQQQPSTLNQGLEMFVGRNAIITQVLTEGQGRVQLADSYFTVFCDQPLQVGQSVRVVAVKNNGLIVQVV